MRIRSTTLASRGRVAKTPPFGEEICCLAGFLGETGDSGPNQGLDGRAKSREIVACFRTNYGRNFSHVSESRSGLIIGEFAGAGGYWQRDITWDEGHSRGTMGW